MTLKEHKIEDLLEQAQENALSLAQRFTVEKESAEDEKQLKNTTAKLIQKISKNEDIPFEHALIGLCGLMQSGAYLKSVSNRKIKMGGKEFTKKSILFAIDQIECKYPLRKIARLLKHTIAQVAMEQSIPGNLYAKFKIENANLIAQSNAEDIKKYSTYCADFQIENPDTPPIVREFLANREKNRKKPSH